MQRSRRFAFASMVSGFVLVLSTLAVSVADAAKPNPLPVAKVVLFSSDGMRPDLMEQYAAQGFMPTYRSLMNAGVRGSNGMVQVFPPNTGVGWYSMATGTYPSEHGSTNNTFFRSGDTFSNRTSFSAAGVLQADTIAAAAERAGKKVAQIDWVGGLNAGIAGPTVDFASFYSNRGVLVGTADASEQAGAAAFSTNYQVGSWVAAAGWTGVPGGDPAAPPMETSGGWSIPTSFAPQNPTRTYNVYAYDSEVDGTAAYDHVVVATNGKDGSAAAPAPSSSTATASPAAALRSAESTATVGAIRTFPGSRPHPPRAGPRTNAGATRRSAGPASAGAACTRYSPAGTERR